ncbi:hypothetical protein BW730_16030 [Tessaracoccus aquimaris]|uniref:Sugar phosphotransferase n=1 Tax=Tessaracoccus aquimaris TaxID=1332264 RepID=A0A1Q2CRQ4_9ACTN|nr:stealth conserved region 3 domain-containing protein [Tessaracoccus aquimaris]AQP48787.1 hypothetical protein BW730_16030 [Tessaracoccus aquimaris]
MLTSAVAVGLHRVERLGQAAAERIGHAWTRRRDRWHATDTTFWVQYRGSSVLADLWESASLAMDATLADCVSALGAIAHQVTREGWELPTIRIAAEDWDAALDAIGRLGRPLYLARLDDDAPVAQRPIASWRAHGLTSPVRAYRVWGEDGRFIAGPDVGVTLTTGAAPEPTFADEDIDIVFTWVDGADPAWRARRSLRRGDEVGLHPTAVNDARYDQIDELRYALRAVERFAPWRRRVFLVTDGQRPAWLPSEFPHVEVVRHDEIFPDPASLPTFNSHAIESRLHHIAGLAERWLYLNDDVFLARYAAPSMFYDEAGRMSVFRSAEGVGNGPADFDDAPVAAATKNTGQMMRRLGHPGVAVTKLKHVPHPQLRSLSAELEAALPLEFGVTANSPFRHPDDLSVASSLAPHLAIATGRGAEARVAHFYADVASPELRWRLPRLLEWRDCDVICLNSTDLPPQSAVNHWLASL